MIQTISGNWISCVPHVARSKRPKYDYRQDHDLGGLRFAPKAWLLWTGHSLSCSQLYLKTSIGQSRSAIEANNFRTAPTGYLVLLSTLSDKSVAIGCMSYSYKRVLFQEGGCPSEGCFFRRRACTLWTAMGALARVRPLYPTRPVA